MSIERNLKGIEWGWDEEKKEENWMHSREPLMNDRGVNSIMTNIVKPVVNKEVMQSHLEEDYIEKMSVQFEDNLADTFFANYERFGITSKQDMNNMVDWIGNLVFVTLRRALRAGERNSMRQNDVREVITHTQGMQKPSMMGGLFKQR